MAEHSYYYTSKVFCLTFYIICYLIAWVDIVTAKPDCNAENIVLRYQRDFDNLVKGCKELGGNLGISIAFDSISISGVERIRGNLFVKDGLSESGNTTKVGDPAQRSINFASLTNIDGNFDVSKFGKNAPYGYPEPYLNFFLPVDVGGRVSVHDTSLSLVNIRIGTCEKASFSDNIGLNGRSSGLPLGVNELELYGNTFSLAVDEVPVYYFPDISEMDKEIYIEASSLSLGDIDSAIIPVYAGLRMPKLERIPKIYVKEAPFVELPNIQNISDALQLVDLKAAKLEYPDLVNIGSHNNGSFIVENAGRLFKVDVPALETVQGDLNFTGNTLLKDIGGFGSLKSVSKDMFFEGPIWSLTFPKLNNVGGNFIIRSSAPFNCTPWNEKQIRTRFAKGDYVCDSEIDPRSLEAGFDRNSVGQDLPGDEPTPTPPNRTPVIVGASVGGVVAIIGITIVVFFFRRRPRKFPDLLPGIAMPELGNKEAPLYEIDAKKTEITAEAVGYIPPTEVPGDFKATELPVLDAIPVEIDGRELFKPPLPAFVRDSRFNREQQNIDKNNNGSTRIPAGEGGRDSWKPHDEAAFSSDRRQYLNNYQFQNGSTE
ncbi:hypothetical protein TWF569_009001 [Orbilia oligospora]|uniref:Receptor L-domain domain-containing protein n=1 Tax=Orbilia oligospora TaxID=2813651 RepID=A0A7C8P112_ORBOL|nr:hypothetical protein TWF706_006922 [Orbilia oligospora]KAF3124843.1 hypothetical protein TWF703_011202 [Orbilia oligospora]KAF3145438.1 hypothetical protein TWF594_004375 [Orbilia oligospora]KAF3155639.1 hypothetical protein TWF569_009001 [Orbilia oligospora]